jgi:hypothetical protein
MTTVDLGQLFQSFTRSAFRLECLEEYDVTEDEDGAAFWSFRNGHPLPQWWVDERQWLRIVRQAKNRGARMQRVRLVYGPLCDYQRFEFEWSYPYNEQAGEQIFVMDTGPGAFGDLWRYEHDYWLFDDATVVRLNYDDDGKFLGVERVADAEPYRRVRDLTLASAERFSEYEPHDIVRVRPRGRTDKRG